jgi:hypothetical protein
MMLVSVISLGAQHAPSSWLNSQMWSAPPVRFQ